MLAFFLQASVPNDLFAIHPVTGPWWAQVWLSQMNLEGICNLVEVYVWIPKAAWWCTGQYHLTSHWAHLVLQRQHLSIISGPFCICSNSHEEGEKQPTQHIY